MATHSSILTWRISWTEEPGGLQSMGSQRVKYNWVTNSFTFHKAYTGIKAISRDNFLYQEDLSTWPGKHLFTKHLLLSSSSLVPQTVKRLPTMRETWVQSLGQEENGTPFQYSCLENPMDGGTWLGYSPWCRKESDTTERLHSLHSSYYELSSSLWSPLPSSLGFPGNSTGKESTTMQKTSVRFMAQEDPLEKGTATHSSILAWRTPWTEEAGGLQSMG